MTVPISFAKQLTVNWLQQKWYFVSKIVLTYCEQKSCSCDLDLFLKFKDEGQKFAKFLRSLEQFIQNVIDQSSI